MLFIRCVDTNKSSLSSWSFRLFGHCISWKEFRQKIYIWSDGRILIHHRLNCICTQCDCFFYDLYLFSAFFRSTHRNNWNENEMIDSMKWWCLSDYKWKILSTKLKYCCSLTVIHSAKKVACFFALVVHSGSVMTIIEIQYAQIWISIEIWNCLSTMDRMKWCKFWTRNL